MKPVALAARRSRTRETSARWNAAAAYRRSEESASKDDGLMLAEARASRLEAVAAHPVSELLDCPPETVSLLTAAARTIAFEAGDLIFRQSSPCAGLYLTVQGQLLRRTERLDMRISLGTTRPGELVELAAALGDRRHTYSLLAQTTGSLLMLPMDALEKAFASYPPLRMKLLEELAREVSRAYHTCSLARRTRSRRSSTRAVTA